MKRQIPGLSRAATSSNEPEDGEYLVRLTQVHYHWDKKKPYYIIKFEIVEPLSRAGQTFNGRIYCSVKALWKLYWFLKDFGYDSELLGRDELDERAMRGLVGVVRIAHKTFESRSILSLEAFASADQWEHLFGRGERPEAA